MRCYVGGRRTGKTTRIIELSHDTGIPILVHSAQIGRLLEHQARVMGKDIPKPVCAHELSMSSGARRDRRVLVDEMGLLVESVFKVQIVAASIDGEALACANPALADMGLIETFRRWWQAHHRPAGGGRAE